MMLTDRKAADIRAGKVVGELHGKVNVALRSGSGDGLTLRNTLGPATSEMSRRLIEIYAQLDGASERPLRDELVEVITRNVMSFIQSVKAAVRGVNVGAAARLAANLMAMHSMAIPTEFDLAAYEAHQKQDKGQSAPPRPIPTRLKHDKLGILDSPSLYPEDFKTSVGVLGVAVIYFDLDNFKAINTRFTEPVIDRTLLSELNKLIAALADGRGIAYAEGGDEFIVMLPNTNAALAEAFTIVLLDAIRTTTFLVDGAPVNVTASAGVVSSINPEDGQTCREAAALAKKRAKDDGRDRYSIATTPQ